MENESPFTRIAQDLLPIFEEPRKREPILHRAAFGTTVDDFARMMAPDYWEVGASGRRYSRGFILKGLEQHPPADAETVGWVCSDFGLRQLGLDTYLRNPRCSCVDHEEDAILEASAFTGDSPLVKQARSMDIPPSLRSRLNSLFSISYTLA